MRQNLDRAELAALERDEYIAEWGEGARKTGTNCASFKRCRGNEGVRAASCELGIARDDADRAFAAMSSCVAKKGSWTIAAMALSQ
jgi:hypothetical protein